MVDPKIRAKRQFKRLVQENPDLQFEDTEDSRLMKYETDGEFDYGLYKRIQTLGNKMKLDMQFVSEDHIKILADFLNERLPNASYGICHGTRQGLEQVWFSKHLDGNSTVIGTEISDTATEFPNTIQWDFHDVKDEWIRKIDFIYSNSWDHSYDPKVLFPAWVSCLRPGGMMLVDYSWGQTKRRADVLDAFGTSEKGLRDLLIETCGASGALVDTIEGADTEFAPRREKDISVRTIVFQAS